MATPRPHTRPKAGSTAGFSLLEVLVSITILAVGMLALAGMISKTSGSTDRSRYMSMAGLLTSAKLEELTRLPILDPTIQIVTGSSAGSLASDAPSVIIGTKSVIYFDEVYLSSGAGTVTETISQPSSLSPFPAGFLVQVQTPDAGSLSKWQATAPPLTADTLNFERRWVIEDSTITGFPTGVRRITVQVSLLNTPVQPMVTFQMSTVRQ